MSDNQEILKLLQMKNLSEVNPVDLLELSVRSVLDIKPVILKLKDLTEMTRTSDQVSFNDVRKFIVYPKDQADKREFKLTLPFIDERKLKEYRGKYRRIPPIGHFQLMNSSVKKLPLGLLEIKIAGFNQAVNENDNRYLKNRVVFKELVYFIYDFEMGAYLRVDTDELEAARKHYSQEGTSKNIDNERVKMFIEREKLLNKVLEGAKNLAVMSGVSLEELKNIEANFQELDKIKYYLEKSESFINQVFPTWLNTKLVFSKITEKEYLIIEKVARKIKQELSDDLEILNGIYKSSKIRSTKGFHSASEELNEISKIMNNSLLSIRRLLSERGDNLEDGYFVFQDTSKNWIVIESFFEIEKRDFQLEEKLEFDTIENEKKQIIKSRSGR